MGLALAIVIIIYGYVIFTDVRETNRLNETIKVETNENTSTGTGRKTSAAEGGR